jgi:hypothetical protein
VHDPIASLKGDKPLPKKTSTTVVVATAPAATITTTTKTTTTTTKPAVVVVQTLPQPARVSAAVNQDLIDFLTNTQEFTPLVRALQLADLVSRVFSLYNIIF